MKILLVVPLFPPDKGVSTLRAKFFYDEMSKKHDVDILKFGEKTDLNGNIKTIEQSLFANLLKTVSNSDKIKGILKETLTQYDCCIVSAPPYNIYEFGKIATDLKVPVIYDYRDHPDLIYYQNSKKSVLKRVIHYVLLNLKERYIFSRFRDAYAILCVGFISTTILQNKNKDLKNIYNCSNGFLNSDLDSISQDNNSCKKDEYVIGCGGNIYEFRDSKDFRLMIKNLDKLAESNKITLLHFGSLSDSLNQYVSKLKNLKYKKHEQVDRDTYLKKLQDVDSLLLVCSDSLIWEPTTTVYDYILYNKPVIYCGLRNNEAYRTLQECGTSIVTNENLNMEQLTSSESFDSSKIDSFSREYRYSILEKLLVNLEKNNDI